MTTLLPIGRKRLSGDCQSLHAYAAGLAAIKRHVGKWCAVVRAIEVADKRTFWGRSTYSQLGRCGSRFGFLLRLSGRGSIS
jgi:hypothetical protein